MKLQVKKRSNSLIVVLPKNFINFHKIEENDWINLDDMFVLKRKHNPLISDGDLEEGR